MSPPDELPLLLTWDSREASEGTRVLALGFLPGRTEVVGLERRVVDQGPPSAVDGGPEVPCVPSEAAPGCWQIPLTAAEQRAGELSMVVRYRWAPPLVSSLSLVTPDELGRAWTELQGGIVARTHARCHNGQFLEGEARRVFDWFSAFELRSNDQLLKDGGGERHAHVPAEIIALIGSCRTELKARLKARAEMVLSRRLLRAASRSDHFVELASRHLAPVPLPDGRVPSLVEAVRLLGDAAAETFRLHPNERPEFQRRLLEVRDRILDAADGGWCDFEPEEIGRCFRLFAQGGLRLDDQLDTLNAEPDSAYFFLFAELAISLSELPQAPQTMAGVPALEAGERLRWRRIARELVLSEHLYRRAYSPGPSLLVHDFDAFGRANLDREPRRRTTDEELGELERVYDDLDPAKDSDWQEIVDDHALLVGLACPGWLVPWEGLSKRLADVLRQVRVSADGPRGEGHTVRLFVRHMISGFVALPHGALDGRRTLTSLGLVGEPLVQLAESLRGYVRRRSHGTRTLMASELRDRTVDQVLRLVVSRCRVRSTCEDAGDELALAGRPAEHATS